MNDILALIAPCTEYEAEYHTYVAEFTASGEPAMFYRLPGEDFGAFVAQLEREARGEGLADWMVPQHVYWAVCDGRIVGILKLRHRLTPALENYGGHIGYAVRPTARRRGYASQMLALGLDKARALGLRRVLLTCNVEIHASARVIEKNGGVRDTDGIHPDTGMPHARFWISL